MLDFKLISPALYSAMSPKEQGYISCLQAGMEGNELPTINPNKPDSARALQWQRGWKKAEKTLKRYENTNDNEPL